MTKLKKFVSVIIPNYRGARTIEKCLEAAYASHYPNFEVIVVDDCSDDNSLALIKKFPCKLIRLKSHCGAARARNVGAAQSSGDFLFFTDSDCLLQTNSLTVALETLSEIESNVVMGGTYTYVPFDTNFYGLFQSVFIHYSETRKKSQPDYIASHAMLIKTQYFFNSGGFTEKFLPILEDVDFSHRLRQAGYRLKIDPRIQVQHIFNFSLFSSLRNAVKKSMYWTIYSINHGDIFVDSGTASIGLKINVVCWFSTMLTLLIVFATSNTQFILFSPFIFVSNLYINKDLVKIFYHTNGFRFSIIASVYYLLIYPIAVGFGILIGILKYLPVTHKLRDNN